MNAEYSWNSSGVLYTFIIFSISKACLTTAHVRADTRVCKEDRVYFWRKAGKALKKSEKTGKNTENVAGNQKTPFWSHGKMKKNLRKAGKSIFFLRKAGNRPPFPALIKRGLGNGAQRTYTTNPTKCFKSASKVFYSKFISNEFWRYFKSLLNHFPVRC